FENFVSNLDIYSRANMLKEISSNVINNNKIFQELQLEQKTVCLPKEKLEKSQVNNLIEQTFIKIQSDSSKKVIFLRAFLENLKDVSDIDVNVILNSFKNKSDDEIKDELSNLVKIFKIKE
ncbi:MAG TPA: hypothetical protein VGB37_02855, partial [Candidatus Lokiarchaeia archaeon]